jgi:hypothetical protein
MLYNLFIFLPIIGVILFAAFFLKRKKTKKFSRIEMKELNSKYKNWDGEATLILLIFITPLFTYVVNSLIMGMISDQISYSLDNQYFFRDGIIGIVPCVFFTIIFIPAVLHLNRIRLGKAEYQKYAQYQIQRDRLFSMRFYALIIPVYLNFMILSLDDYVRITDQEFIINPYFSFTEKKYSLKEIKNIHNTTYSGRRGYSLGYVIEFKDGYKFDFFHSTNRLKLSKQAEVVNYIKNRLKK